MARKASIPNLIKLVANLRKQREAHVAALAKIDEVFTALGSGNGGVPGPFVKSATPAPTARVKAPGAKRRGKRGKFKQTAVEFVLALLDGKTLKTSEVNAAWKEAGRGGTANVALMNLVKAKKLTRKEVKDGRGSMYTVA